MVAPGGEVRISKYTVVGVVGATAICFLGRKASQAPRAMNNTNTAGAPNLNQGAVIQEAPRGAGAGLVTTLGAGFVEGDGGVTGGCGGGVAGSEGAACGGLNEGAGGAAAPGFAKMVVAAPTSGDGALTAAADLLRAAAGGWGDIDTIVAASGDTSMVAACGETGDTVGAADGVAGRSMAADLSRRLTPSTSVWNSGSSG